MKTLNISTRLTPTSKSSSNVNRATQSNILRTLAARWTQLGNRIWQTTVDAIAADAEPRIWQESDRQGSFHWRAYDPVSGSYFSGSETEMRRWIEQRYYA